jgi:hypothetical protein
MGDVDAHTCARSFIEGGNTVVINSSIYLASCHGLYNHSLRDDSTALCDCHQLHAGNIARAKAGTTSCGRTHHASRATSFASGQLSNLPILESRIRKIL